MVSRSQRALTVGATTLAFWLHAAQPAGATQPSLTGLPLPKPSGSTAAESFRIAQAPAANPAEQKRISEEEASFLKLLAEERAAEAEAKRKAAEEAAKKKAEAEEKRVTEEEASFLKLLAEERAAEAEAKRKAQEEAARKKAEAEKKRLADEEASFMKLLAEERAAEAEAKRKAAEAKAAEEKQKAEAATEAKRKAEEEAKARVAAAEACAARLRETAETGKIQFASGRYDIPAAATATLNKIAEIANACPSNLKISVEGHTDASGPDNINQIVSEERAKAVADYLRTRGVAGERISSRGFGETKPIATNATAQGRAQNRRIEFIVE